MAIRREDRVEDALRRAADEVRYEGEGVWTLAFQNGSVSPARARVANGWLAVRVALPVSVASKGGDLTWLDLNARLPGSTRIGQAVGDRMPHLVADTCIADEPDPDERIASLCGELTGALHTLADRIDASPGVPGRVLQPCLGSTEEVALACAEAGWAHVAGVDGRVQVHIESRTLTHTARVGSSACGWGSVEVDLVDMTGQAAVSRQAVARALLAISASFRMVKGATYESGGAAMAGLVSPVDGAIASSLDRALSALSAAIHLAGREVRALRDERLAADYLALCVAARQQEPGF